jgi:hypothetical protein
MRIVQGIVFLVVVGALAGLTWLWIVQNADQHVQMHLDLSAAIGAWTMAEPMPATHLVLWSFGAGFGVAATLFGLWGLGQRARAGRAERTLALHEPPSGDGFSVDAGS